MRQLKYAETDDSGDATSPQPLIAILRIHALAQLAYNFAKSVFYYFYGSEEAFAWEETVMIGLLISLSALSQPPSKEAPKNPELASDELDEFYSDTSRAIPADAQYDAKSAIESLEYCWMDLSKACAELKLFCEA